MYCATKHLPFPGYVVSLAGIVTIGAGAGPAALVSSAADVVLESEMPRVKLAWAEDK